MMRDAKNITVDIPRYVDTWDYVILAFEFVYYIFVAYYIVEEVLEIIKIGKKLSVTIDPLVKLVKIIKAGVTSLESGTTWTFWS